MTIISPISTLNTASTTAQTIINGALRIQDQITPIYSSLPLPWIV